MRSFLVAMEVAVLLVFSSVTAGAVLPPGGTYTDDNGNYHEPAIEAITAAGIDRGCNPPANDNFCPDHEMTRVGMAVWLIRALGEEGNMPAYQGYFDDVSPATPAMAFYTPYVERLYQLGITLGVGNNLYDPYGSVTRAQMAVYLIRAFDDESGLPAATGRFGDVLLSEASNWWYRDHVERLYDIGITLGCSADPLLYCPDVAVPRDQMASFVARAMGLTLIYPPPPNGVEGTWNARDGDGSNLWLFIDRQGTSDRYDVVYYDDFASSCSRDQEPAELVTTGTQTGNLLQLPSDPFECFYSGDLLGPTAIGLTYDPAGDSITDTLGAVFQRSPFFVEIHPADWLRCGADLDEPCFSTSLFDTHGYAGDPAIAGSGASRTHAYGAGSGMFLYLFDIPFTPPGDVTVTAWLSSEFPWYAGPPDGYSDVELIVHSTRRGVKTVAIDDGAGQMYQWTFPGGDLMAGIYPDGSANALAFSTMSSAENNGAYQGNGIAIYADSLVPGVDDARIYLSFDTDHFLPND